MNRGGEFSLTLDSTLVSQEDRDQTIEVLQEQVAKGRLTLEEFEARMEIASGAETQGALRGVVHDLPSDE